MKQYAELETLKKLPETGTALINFMKGTIEKFPKNSPVREDIMNENAPILNNKMIKAESKTEIRERSKKENKQLKQAEKRPDVFIF